MAWNESAHPRSTDGKFAAQLGAEMRAARASISARRPSALMERVGRVVALREE